MFAFKWDYISCQSTLAAILFDVNAAIVIYFDLKHQFLGSVDFFDHVLFLPEEHSLLVNLLELGRELYAFID